jgi:hypothetical protein
MSESGRAGAVEEGNEGVVVASSSDLGALLREYARGGIVSVVDRVGEQSSGNVVHQPFTLLVL